MQSQWTLQDAKNKFSEVVNAACTGSPQVVTKRGTPSVVVLSMTTYETLLEHTKAPVPRFTDFLLSMPCADDPDDPDDPDDADDADDADAITSHRDIALREVKF